MLKDEFGSLLKKVTNNNLVLTMLNKCDILFKDDLILSVNESGRMSTLYFR